MSRDSYSATSNDKGGFTVTVKSGTGHTSSHDFGTEAEAKAWIAAALRAEDVGRSKFYGWDR